MKLYFKMCTFIAGLLLLGCTQPSEKFEHSPASNPAPHDISHLAQMTEDGVIDLSGLWRWSVDPYGDGYSGFHGGQAGFGSRRYNFLTVEDEMRKNPTALFEYDMDHAETAKIPGAWVGHAPEMRHYQGIVWYQRDFEVSPQNNQRVFLEFGAVNYRADVYLNGESIGAHEGGFTPFSFEVTSVIREGKNVLTLGVDSRRDWQSVPPPVTDWETYGGITRPIKVVLKSQTFIENAWVRLSQDGGILVDVQLDGPNKAQHPISFEIAELGLSVSSVTGPQGKWMTQIPVPKNLKRWSPDLPQLYNVTLKTETDTFKERIGFRTIEVVGEDILLNGDPIFLRGISLHEEEIGPNPIRDMTENHVRALLDEIKTGLNGNFVRLAHYPHSDVTTRLADEMGLIVWSEIPVYWRIDWESPQTLSLAKNMIKENILRDRNRASILFWSVGNETPISEPRNLFMKALIEQTRELDSSRLVTAALMTAKEEEEGVLTARITDPLAAQLDVLAVNTYDGWYGPVPVNEVSEIRWVLGQNKPLIFSEFGAGAFIGLSGEDIPRKFSLEYQDDMYRETLEMSEHIKSLRGISPWILKDFRSPRRQHSIYQNGWNRKGVITETGERKPAFSTLSDHYSKLEREWNNRPE